MNQIAYPQVTSTVTKDFAKAWTYKGIVVALDDTSIQFATDWANMVLRQVFVSMAQAQMAQAAASQNTETKSETKLVEG